MGIKNIQAVKGCIIFKCSTLNIVSPISCLHGCGKGRTRRGGHSVTQECSTASPSHSKRGTMQAGKVASRWRQAGQALSPCDTHSPRALHTPPRQGVDAACAWNVQYPCPGSQLPGSV